MIKSKYGTQAFLGSTNYYAPFIKDYATLAKPLYGVLKKPGKDKCLTFELKVLTWDIEWMY